MSPSALLTVPVPVPSLRTVSVVTGADVNVAVTLLGVVKVTVH
jgi:hypothetical protein